MIVMSAGPTSISDRVRKAMVRDFTNSDLDRKYPAIQHGVEAKISRLLHTDAPTFLMLAEPMAGLEGACASFVEEGTRVLCLVNGPFSQFLADFAGLYGGETVIIQLDQRRGIVLDELAAFLEKDHDFKLATWVHCETPTGVTHEIHAVGQLLASYGILSIVDSVSGMGGEAIHFDEAQIDCLISGSQKCLSAPPGLTSITLSPRAVEYLMARTTKIRAYYVNFLSYLLEEEFEFPYTHSDNLVYALDEALDIALGSDHAARHAEYARWTRQAIEDAGLEIFARINRSNTVTAIRLPDGISGDAIQDQLQDRGYILSGGLNQLHGHIIRVAHMGNNIADESRYLAMLDELSRALTDQGLTLKIGLKQAFERARDRK